MSVQARDLARRSVELILGNQTPSGAFIASPTFSQYGYCWLRDGAFTAYALDLVGEHVAASRFHDWVTEVVLARSSDLRRAIGSAIRGGALQPNDCLHCRYAADGSESAVEWPTFQLDGPGIWLWALGEHVAAGGELAPRRAAAARLAAEYVAALWGCASYDAWEESPDRLHSSTVGAIAAGLRSVERYLDDGVAQPWSGVADVLVRHLRDIARDGYVPKWPGNVAVDASLLWLGYPYRLFPLDDPLFAATVARIETDLVSAAGGVHRYLDDTYYGGGEWVLLTAAIGSVYAERGAPGDRERARRCSTWIERQADGDGQLPEQVAEHALHPEWVDHWVRLWGPSARPLVWSHATYLVLHHQLEAMDR